MELLGRPNDYHILVVDDLESCRNHLRTVLEPVGFQVHQAESGEEALDVLEDKLIHLLCCDMHMKRLSGLQTVQLARQIRPPIPCILVTAQADDRLMQQAMQANVFSVLSKPVDQHELLFTTQRALGRVYGKPMASSS